MPIVGYDPDGIPLVPCIRRKGQLVIIKCPFYKQYEHWHGGPTGTDDDYGHRVAHCIKNAPPRGYILVPAIKKNATKEG